MREKKLTLKITWSTALVLSQAIMCMEKEGWLLTGDAYVVKQTINNFKLVRNNELS
jgi:hypothetical protein